MSRFAVAAVLLVAVASSVRAAIPLAIHQGTSATMSPAEMANMPEGTSHNSTGGAKNASNTTTSGNNSGSPNSSSCFPADATVVTFAGAVKRMDELLAGDRVHVGRGQFSEVFMFTHKSADVAADFIVIDAALSGARLRVTPGHYLYVNEGLAAASTVVVGDAIELADGSVDTVAAVSSAVLQGLYNPQTLQGDIVVDGVRASTYTTAVAPVFAHAVLTPLRAAYRALGWSTDSFNEASHYSGSLPSGPGVC
jgi:Hint module